MHGFGYLWHPFRNRFLRYRYACERWESQYCNDAIRSLMIVNTGKILHLCGFILSYTNYSGTARTYHLRVANDSLVERLTLAKSSFPTAQAHAFSVSFNPPTIMKDSLSDRLVLTSGGSSFEVNVNAWGFETDETG